MHSDRQTHACLYTFMHRNTHAYPHVCLNIGIHMSHRGGF